MTPHDIEGFDPLAENHIPGGLEKSIAEEAVRREVLNILKSYTGYFDLFSELLQNSLDAVDIRKKLEGDDYKPRIQIEIDISKNRVRVCDNGCGMDSDQFRFCFRPNVSFKSRKDSRGHKGVGATFVAYGFSSVRLITKQKGGSIAGQLNSGRQWAEDTSGSFPRPRFSAIAHHAEGLEHETSGTCVEVLIESQQRPKLAWIQATNADQWLDLLRIKTPIGGIYLSASGRDINVEYHVKVTDLSGKSTYAKNRDIDYYYPHEIPLIYKQKSLSEIEKKIQSISGDLSTRLQKLPDEFRRLDAVWDVWKSEDILKEIHISRNLDEDQKILVSKHDITVYGCFLSSAKTWTTFQKDILKVHPNAVLLRGGLQLASDFMPQGDLSVIPLTSTIGYQNNTHIVVHLRDGNPDMGRKVFQPEIKALADELGRRAVDVFKRYLSLMREDTGAPTGTAARDLRDFIKQQETYRESKPLALRFRNRACALQSEPQSEQDVIALFHELVGMGIFEGYGFLATSESERYDSIFVTNYEDDSALYSVERKLGVSPSSERRESIPYVLEYKYDSDALVDDFAKEKKYPQDIKLLVCWRVGQKTAREFGVSPYLVGEEGSVREFFGSTHALYQLREKRLEVICLRDLISYLRDPDEEEARQSQYYAQ
ncbi:ATP-binding protein [Mesorhizobium sp. LSHC412B00]|uniref:ATP-binding protein n=1 Tax=Mesorhizobium sp. LSHC412B00 TaxID=1287285 RepID=UPI0004103E52|nr:ATP-binding protein [Mesorhizobium sp. LSHC412B00]